MMNAKFFIFVVMLMSAFSLRATELTINGSVLEKGIRKPIQGVQVSAWSGKACVAAAVTDAQGRFHLMLPGEGNFSLNATLPGMNEQTLLDLEVKQGEVPTPVIYLHKQETMGEMVVTAERSPDRVSKNTLSGKTVGKLAGSSGDPLMALQNLPGVIAVNGSSAPAVRGSGPGDNLYYVDGLFVGKLFHLDSISVFNADLIRDFNLYGAAFAPHYNNVAGAVIDVALREPRKDRLGGKINVNVMGASFLVEGPRTENQSFYLAARRSYADMVTSQVRQLGVTGAIPKYSDYQGKYLWQVNDSNRLTFHLHGAADTVTYGWQTDSDSGTTQAAVLDSMLTEVVSNTLSLENGNNFTSNKSSTSNLNVTKNNVLLRDQVRFNFSLDDELVWTNEFNSSRVKVDMLNSTCAQSNSNCNVTTSQSRQLYDYSFNEWSVAAQYRKRASQYLTLVGGVRQSAENYAHKRYTEPRLGAEWEWSKETLLTAGWGKHNQNPLDEQWARYPNLDHIRAEHSVVGVKHKVNADWNWKTEAYYKKLSNLPIYDPALNYVNAGSGKAYGVEILIKKEETDKLSGWFVLNLARSQRQNDITGASYRFDYDEPVNATLVGTYKFSEEWSFGGKWNYHSGAPYTQVVGTTSGPNGGLIPVSAGVNSGSLPAYHRLDLRLDRSYVFDTWKMNAYFELNNVYQRKNIVGYSYDPTYTRRAATPAFVLPISFGVQGDF